ncbi:hypothetical protein P9112_006829 [Eukaryota sp. TZLM1-RC]
MKLHLRGLNLKLFQDVLRSFRSCSSINLLFCGTLDSPDDSFSLKIASKTDASNAFKTVATLSLKSLSQSTKVIALNNNVIGISVKLANFQEALSHEDDDVTYDLLLSKSAMVTRPALSIKSSKSERNVPVSVLDSNETNDLYNFNLSNNSFAMSLQCSLSVCMHLIDFVQKSKRCKFESIEVKATSDGTMCLSVSSVGDQMDYTIKGLGVEKEEDDEVEAYFDVKTFEMLLSPLKSNPLSTLLVLRTAGDVCDVVVHLEGGKIISRASQKVFGS